MGLKTYVLSGAAAVVIIGAVAAYMVPHKSGSASAPPAEQDFAVMATPPGITLVSQGDPKGTATDGQLHVGGINRGAGAVVAFADTNGMTYYTFDKDIEAGKSVCTSDCAKAWPPAIAPTDAKPAGNWSVIGRDDGTHQWAYKGKPLYTSAKDELPGQAKGDGDDKAWHTAVFRQAVGAGNGGYGGRTFRPEMPGPAPFGIDLQEVEDAGGQTLTDETGRTLYAYYGDIAHDVPSCAAGGCISPWKPLAAAALAGDVGAFTAIRRPDGTRQWAYKGHALYRYAGDTQPGLANGAGIDRRFRAAVLLRYPSPAPISVQNTDANGKVFATSQGKSLYREQIYYYTVDGHGFYRGVPYQGIVGRAIGTRGCDDACAKTWHPFLASADARPAGYWTIVARADGSRQWAYKGYALYTYDKDKSPGELLGLNSWSLSINDPSLHSVSFLTTLKIDAEIMSGIFWTTAYP